MNRTPSVSGSLVFYSTFETITRGTKLDIAHFTQPDSHVLMTKLSNVAMLQTSGYDCRLYDIANASAHAFEMNLAQHGYIPNVMKARMINCVENSIARVLQRRRSCMPCSTW